MNTSAALKLRKPSAHIDFFMEPDAQNDVTGLDAPALELFTDFYLMPAISVLAATTIDNALAQMIRHRVRLLFVVNVKFTILGVITSYDIQGEKPLRYLQSRDCRIGTCSREDVLVQDIMLPVHKWRVVTYEQVAQATVADVVKAFKELGQRHLIVVDAAKDRNGQVVRGLFSLATLERALGTSVASTTVASSFAEIKDELGL